MFVLFGTWKIRLSRQSISLVAIIVSKIGFMDPNIFEQSSRASNCYNCQVTEAQASDASKSTSSPSSLASSPL